MANYANNTDVADYVPDVFDYEVVDFTSELTRATDMVNKRLKGEWWRGASNDFDTDKLNAAQWKETTVYAALAYFILPKLSSFRPDDTFLEMSLFYRDRFEDTYKREVASGVDYDDNNDGQYTDAERVYTRLDRLVR
jgi:hypothetical protein